jgi:hypothetical protein
MNFSSCSKKKNELLKKKYIKMKESHIKIQTPYILMALSTELHAYL